MADTIRALVLPADSAGSDELQTVSGMPGLWRPGVPYLPSALGLSEADAERLLEEAPSAVVWTEVEADAAADFESVGLQIPTELARVEEDRARESASSRSQRLLTAEDGRLIPAATTPSVAAEAPGWVEAARARATALSLGERPPDPREALILSELEHSSKSELERRAEEAGIQRASTMTKATLVERLQESYFGGGAGEPGDEVEAVSSETGASGEGDTEEAAG